MEKVLRKVSVKKRFPSTKDYYYVILLKGEDRAVREYSPSYDNWWKENVEYWYEEVSVDELQEVIYLNEQLKGANARLDCIPTYISHIKCLEEEAKERYEKGFKYIAKVILRDTFDSIETEIVKALKVAAGIEEDV